MRIERAGEESNVASNFGNDKPAKSQRSGQTYPPYNPGLQKLIEGKQTWAESLAIEAKRRGFTGWHQRGYLPHHDIPGVTQFVTFRLHDAMPFSRRSEWETLLALENNRQRRTQLEAYLDQGLGECWLRQPCLADLVEGALRYSDESNYQLRAWVVMPNHVHVVVDVWQTPLARLLRSWKGFTARQANKLQGRQGTFWEREYWDTLMRHEEQLAKAVRYTENNPVKAGLISNPAEWPWSSARFRDPCGELRIPQKKSGL